MGLIKRDTAGKESADQEQRQRSRDFAGLLENLNDSNPTARRWSARDLADFPEGCDALLARVQIEDNVSVREVILTSLTKLGGSAAIQCMVDWLQSDDSVKRNEAIATLKAMADIATPVIRGLLADPDPHMRIMAANILEAIPAKQVEEWLIDILHHDESVNVCGAALDVLVEIASTAAIEPLQMLKQRFPDEPYIQFSADLALKQINKV